LVEDHPIYSRALRRLIEEEPDLVVCGEAGSAKDALSMMRKIRPDAAVVDISLPGSNGIELIKNLRAEHESLAILVLSMHDESLYAVRALKAGAFGYLSKRESAETFLAALRKVLAGEIHVSPEFGNQLLSKAIRGGGAAMSNPIDALSDRELEVLHLIGEGKSTNRIAETLGLSIKTIESHRLKMKDKLGFETASELIRFAVEWVGGLNRE
jgi:DNA-binding NarL/FixJ family response regulator